MWKGIYMDMNIQDYIKHFNHTFNTNIPEDLDITKFPMLELTFNSLGEYFYKPSSDYNKITEVSSPIEKKLIDTMTDEQKSIYEDYLENEAVLKSEIVRQILVFGYLVAYQELKEMDALK